MSDKAKLAAVKVTRECALCGLITEEAIVVCPEDGSALITHKPDPLIGSVIGGKFEILSLLGAGGMGNVYKALQKSVGRHVAVKVLHTEQMRKNQSVVRFQQEAKAAAALSHANIVGFFDYGLTEDNIPYIVMDYVEGTPLDEVLRKDGVLSIERCISIFGEACAALEHAHQKGVIHRDIKPSNLMLTKKDDGSETVKILDFGIAKLLPSASEDAEKVNLTQTGEVFGSPQYMSPEQCNGGTLDARSDIYSLGCVMYEALVGRPPLRGDNIVQTVYKHTHEQPAPFKTVRPDLDFPRQLEVLVMKALEKEPSMRFPSMSVLKRNLEFVTTFAEHEKTLPPETKAPDVVPKRRGWVRWAVGTAVVILVLGGGAGWYFLSNDAEAQISVTEMLDGRNSHKLLAPLRAFRNKMADAGKNREAFEYALRAVSLSKQTEPDTMDEASDLIAAADILAQQKDDRAREYLVQAREKLRKLAVTGRHQDRWQDNLSIDDRISMIDKQLAESNDGEGLADQLAQGEDLRNAGASEQVPAVYDHLIANKSKLTREQLATLFMALSAVADDMAVRGKSDKAESYYKAAVAIGTDVWGAGHDRVLQTKRSLGLFYQKASRYTSAEQVLQDTLAQANDSLGSTNDLSIQLLEDLSKLYDDMKEFKTANEMRKLADSLKAQRP